MIYFLRHPKTGLVKIGTTDKYHRRLSTLMSKYGDLELVALMDGNRTTEAALHVRFGAANRQGVLDGREWFADTPELREFIEVNGHLNIPENEDELIRIPVSSETHERLKELARVDGKSLSDFLRDIVQRELGEKVNMRKGLKTWGGRRDRQPE